MLERKGRKSGRELNLPIIEVLDAVFHFFSILVLLCARVSLRLVSVFSGDAEAALLFSFSSMAPILFVVVAFPCTVGAMALAVLHIYRHLLNYTEPTYQRYIVRIIFMVPVCCLFHWFPLSSQLLLLILSG